MTAWDKAEKDLARGMCMPSAPPPYDFVARNEIVSIDSCKFDHIRLPVSIL
jgi:hypothetical protein